MKKVFVEAGDEFMFRVRKYGSLVVAGSWLDELFWQLMFPSILLFLAVMAGEFGWGGSSMVSWALSGDLDVVPTVAVWALGIIMIVSSLILVAFVLFSVLLLNERWQLMQLVGYWWKDHGFHLRRHCHRDNVGELKEQHRH